ncbi:MAG: hypothetical protein BGN95_18885 [Sphingomonas sp. 66-10]|nr:MAG: hypothetical protein BGN95_18885 [Sphingomonas sp. 66-10]
MNEVRIECGKHRALAHQPQYVGAHRNQRSGGVGRLVEPPQQLLPRGFGGLTDAAERVGRRRRAIGVERALDRRGVGAELLGQGAEEFALGADIEPAISREELLRGGDPRRLAAFLQQLLREAKRQARIAGLRAIRSSSRAPPPPLARAG